MTDTDDQPSESSSESVTEESSTRSPTGDSDSRFEEFLDRLDERARKREGRELDEEITAEGGEMGSAHAPETTADSERESHREGSVDDEESTRDGVVDDDGWMWGAPVTTPDSEADSTDEAIDGQTARRQSSDSDGARVWNADPDDLVESDDSKRTSDLLDEETGATPGGERRDRWFEIGSSLGANTSDDGPADPPIDSDQVTENAADTRTHGSSEGEKSYEDDGSRFGRDERGLTETDTVSTEDSITPDGHSLGGAAFAGDGLSSELNRVSTDSSVLVLGPTDHTISDAICSRFLTSEAGSSDVIFVTFDDSLEDRIGICHRADGWTGGKIGVIEVGRGSRNAPASSETTGSTDGGSITVRYVSKPGNLSKLGILITQLLGEFDETPRRTVLCFHTLSALHREVGTKTLFRFLTTLQSRLNTANAVGHYHMDPDLHDELVIETLRPIFDSVVQFSAEGDVDIE